MNRRVLLYGKLSQLKCTVIIRPLEIPLEWQRAIICEMEKFSVNCSCSLQWIYPGLAGSPKSVITNWIVCDEPNRFRDTCVFLRQPFRWSSAWAVGVNVSHINAINCLTLPLAYAPLKMAKRIADAHRTCKYHLNSFHGGSHTHTHTSDELLLFRLRRCRRGSCNKMETNRCSSSSTI